MRTPNLEKLILQEVERQYKPVYGLDPEYYGDSTKVTTMLMVYERALALLNTNKNYKKLTLSYEEVFKLGREAARIGGCKPVGKHLIKMYGTPSLLNKTKPVYGNTGLYIAIGKIQLSLQDYLLELYAE